MDGDLMNELHGNLTSALSQELREIEETLRRRHPYVQEQNLLRNEIMARLDMSEGATFTRLKDFQLYSTRSHSFYINNYYEWTPSQLTATGKPIIDETVLTEIGTEISTMFARCLTITKMLGSPVEGANAWLKLVTNDRIHHHCSVSQQTRTVVHTDRRISHRCQVTRDLESFISQLQVSLWSALIFSGIELRMLISLSCTLGRRKICRHPPQRRHSSS